MRLLYISAAILVMCILASNGHKLHGQDNGKFKKISFSVDHGDNYGKNHEGSNHNEHHEHYEHHGGNHEEHHVEHHGNNGDDEHHDHHEHHEDNGHVKYEFKYGVKDPKTGDIKQQWEVRDGDKVKGVYSLKDADGTKRIVEYTSDKKKGFEATVHKIGHAHQDADHGQSHH